MSIIKGFLKSLALIHIWPFSHWSSPMRRREYDVPADLLPASTNFRGFRFEGFGKLSTAEAWQMHECFFFGRGGGEGGGKG